LLELQSLPQAFYIFFIATNTLAYYNVIAGIDFVILKGWDKCYGFASKEKEFVVVKTDSLLQDSHILLQ
jgi:hypothetical protein